MIHYHVYLEFILNLILKQNPVPSSDTRTIRHNWCIRRRDWPGKRFVSSQRHPESFRHTHHDPRRQWQTALCVEQSRRISDRPMHLHL